MSEVKPPYNETLELTARARRLLEKPEATYYHEQSKSVINLLVINLLVIHMLVGTAG